MELGILIMFWLVFLLCMCFIFLNKEISIFEFYKICDYPVRIFLLIITFFIISIPTWIIIAANQPITYDYVFTTKVVNLYNEQFIILKEPIFDIESPNNNYQTFLFNITKNTPFTFPEGSLVKVKIKNNVYLGIQFSREKVLIMPEPVND